MRAAVELAPGGRRLRFSSSTAFLVSIKAKNKILRKGSLFQQTVREADAIIGAAIGGIATAQAHSHLRQTMVYLNIFPENQTQVMIGNCSDKFDEQGGISNG